MKKFNKFIALALSAALLCAALPATAQEGDSETAETAVSEEVSLHEETEELAEVIEDANEPIFGDTESDYPYTEQPVGEDEYITNTYGYPIYGDPYNTKKVKQGVEYSASKKKLNDAFWLRDSDLFGVWDEQSGTWSTPSKLDYEAYPEMSRIEAAAKAGNYEQAKLAYYNYYVERENNLNRSKDTSDSTADRITADLLCKNFMYNAMSGISPVGIMDVGNSKQYRGVDVSATVTKYLGTREYLAFLVVATDKNGDWAEFDSKEGENAPYLKLRVDGAEKIIYPTADTNIKAGDNKSKTYGSDTTLTAREDEFGTTTYSHDGLTDITHIFVNSNTSRIYLKFNISDLKSGDTIEAATLNLCGNNMVDGQSRETVVFYSDESTWDEETLTYANATAQVIYSYDQAKSWYWNQPISAGYRYQEELLRFNTWFDKLVKLYNYTGDEKYAYTAIRQFMDYINVRGDDICWLKSLDVAVRTQCMPDLWMQLLGSQYMSPEIFTAFMKWCYVQANGAKYFTRTGNWGTSESLGLYTVTINYPEFKDSQEWLDRVRVRYESLSNEMTRADYSCTELSLGYTDYTLTTLLDAKTAAEDLGIDFNKYSPYTQKTLDNIEHLGLFMYWSSLPGVSDNQVGDGYSHRGNFKTRMESLGNWFNNPQLKYAASDGDEGHEPEFTSTMFPVGLKAVMRTNWSDKAMYFYTDVDGGVGNHSHPDDNSITVAAYGQYLLVDPLYGTYSASAAKTWLTSSIAHNEVVMNGKNQSYNKSTAVGSIPRWETNNTYDFVTGSAKAVPDATEYRRSTFFYRDKLFIVNDYLVPNASNASKSNKYVQAWHYLPEAGITMDEDTKTVKTNFLGANIQVVPIGAEKLDRAENMDGLYSEGQGSILDAKYTEYEKNVVGNAVFNTLLLPENTGEDYEVSAGELKLEGLDETRASAMEIYITSKVTGEMTRYIYYILNDKDKKGTVTVDDFTTDASMLFAEMDYKGNIQYIALQDASMLSCGSKQIFRSDNEIKEFAAKWNGGYLFADSSVISPASLKSNNVRLYSCGKDVQEVKVNGEQTAVSKVDDYIYFGTAPTSAPGATPKPTAVPTKPPVTHGGGGGGGGGYIPPANAVTPKPSATNEPEPTAEPGENPTLGKMNEALKAEIENHWARKEIESLYEKGIINGRTETSFGLESQITRAEFITLLVRAKNLEPQSYSGIFKDVSADDWYADYIEAAYRGKIFEGLGENAEPNSSITREQMAKMLAALCSDGDGDDEFTDSDKISEWAREAVKKTARAGIMQGRSNGEFAPGDSAKRCEAFAVIYRLINQ
ncbi:MAG: S-layer homology domain-containing protein [Clostridiales bacterium]|nr:S-layer homology domain-containing protein [Clostridiales bacterium]